MKKSVIYILVGLTLAFSFFVIGYYVGRNTVDAPISVEGFLTTAPTTTDAGSTSTDGRLNINTATAEQLQTLPGIGPVTAENIIAFRQQYGPFLSVEELLDVDNIGPKTLADIIDLITVSEGSAPPAHDPAEKVNINTATAEQLQTLKNIGPAKADAIIAYRTEHGPFTSIEDLLKVDGIGEKTLNEIRDHITV